MQLHKFTPFLTILPALALAQGGPPLLTDDPATPGDGHYEVNVAFIGSYRHSAQNLATPLVDMNFGVGEHGQLKLEVPIATERANGNGATTGIGSILAGWKWRFHDQDSTFPLDVSVYPQISSGPLSQARSLGFSGRDVRYLLPMEVAHTFGTFSVNGELGYVLRGQNPPETFCGIAFGWNASEGVEWLAERHRILSADPVDREDIVNVGLRHVLDSHLTLLVAAGASPYATTDYTRLNLYLGLQFAN